MNQIDTDHTVANDHTPTGEELLARFGSAAERVERAIEAFRNGKGVLVMDDADRENEGDLIYPAETMSVEQMAFMIRECSGIVCLCLSEERVAELELPQMVQDNSSSMGTGFTVTIEAKRGVTTGVSAADRITTIRTAIDPQSGPDDLARPGHVFPLRARTGGTLTRRGHTEATIDLAMLADLTPAGVLCEVTNIDGSMARLPEIVEFGIRHNLPVLTIEDIVAYREALLKQTA
ncbi:3,4-dihydroxy-2-butanone-4-phosphate synthase [Kiloniella sp. b19]|uniref:3,4-dihydroxy-2-butanone-4-phosphate synthase n=1 Tax=Kiloniella sp. GXU_MW_B19 TaxID=3141326 RepID=UPI0031D62CF8